ncbi:MAG: thrombospondin type 3 repeat-containing protein, partial [Nitrospirota bacterium]
NISLYGNTATITMYDMLGVNIALSTDWTPSGSMNLLRELRCVDYFNSRHLNNYLVDWQMWSMVTSNPARGLSVANQTGSLQQGQFADIAIYNGASAPNYYRAVINAEIKDTVLVLRADLPLFGDKELMDAIPNGQTGCEEIPGGVCSVGKTACIMREVGVDYKTLAAVNASSYPLFFCSTPDKEPTCMPMRPADKYGCGQYPLADPSKDFDGDGVPDSLDNCPTIFNPVRPVDDYSTHQCKQADYNGNGIGDACDVNPLGKI